MLGCTIKYLRLIIYKEHQFMFIHINTTFDVYGLLKQIGKLLILLFRILT